MKEAAIVEETSILSPTVSEYQRPQQAPIPPPLDQHPPPEGMAEPDLKPADSAP